MIIVYVVFCIPKDTTTFFVLIVYYVASDTAANAATADNTSTASIQSNTAFAASALVTLVVAVRASALVTAAAYSLATAPSRLISAIRFLINAFCGEFTVLHPRAIFEKKFSVKNDYSLRSLVYPKRIQLLFCFFFVFFFVLII